MAKKASKPVVDQRALVIGVSDYPDPDDRLPAVAADVREMKKVLSSRHGTFPSKSITVLADKQATRDKVLAELRSVFGSPSADTVFVYLAGHGFEASGKYYYVAYDTTDEATAVPLSEIKTLFDQTTSRRAFLWLDFCHSGGILARGGSSDMDAIRRGIGVVSGHGKVIVAACTSTQQSYESASIGHGFFTYALLRGLKGEAKSAQGEVTAHSLYEFIDHEVANARQQPVFFGETTGRIVLMHYDKPSTINTPTTVPKSTASLPKKSSPKVRGTWVMLGENFLVADRIRNQSDGSIELHITPQSGEQEAAIAAMRPGQFGSRTQLPFAVNNDAYEVQVEEVVSEHVDSQQKWSLKLRSAQRQSGFSMEMSVNGVGPDEIAKKRAGRILLNDPPPRTGRGFSEDSLLESSICGSTDKYQAKECVIREVYRQHGSSSAWKEIARLKAVFLLKITGTVEHVIELTLGNVRNNKVKVSFKGRRSQRYSNSAPEVVEINGECQLA